MVYVWLASSPAKQRYLGQSVYTASQALCATTRDALEEIANVSGEVLPHRIFALVKLEVVCCYSVITPISREARVQLRFWESILRMDLSDNMAFLCDRRCVYPAG